MSASPAFDAETFKRATLSQWEKAASGWNEHTPQIRAWLRTATDAMLTMAGVGPGRRVLDVAAGTGDQTLDIAERVGPKGSVLATDISPGILAYAKANALRAGYTNVEIVVTDAEKLDEVEPESFDSAVCRLGLMFCPDPLEALKRTHRALKPGARICTMVFSTPDTNPCVAILMATAREFAGAAARDPFEPGSLFSLGKPGLIDEQFRKAGFMDVATTQVAAPFSLPSAAAYIDFIRASASPIQQMLGSLDAAKQAAAWAMMEARLQKFATPEGWLGPNALLLTAARR